MASEWIGVVISAESGSIHAVINPDDDAELDNPRMWLIQNDRKEAMKLIRVPRGDYMAALSLDDVAKLVEKLQA